MIKDKLDRKIIKYILLIAGIVLVILNFSKIVGVAGFLWNIIVPLIVGFAIAYILNILVIKIESLYFTKSTNPFVNKSRKSASVILSIITIILAIIFIVGIILPQIIKTISTIVSLVPQAMDNVREWINENKDSFPTIAEQLGKINIDFDSIGKNIANFASTSISGIFSSAIGFITHFTSSLFNLFVSITFAVYLLLGKDKLIGQLKRVQRAYMNSEHARKLNICLNVTNESFTSYITGQVIEAFILGALCTLGMWIFRFPYAATIGVFVGATALIPMVGAYIGAGVGAFLILMVDPLKAILFVVYIILLQQFEGNVIYPRVVGTSVGLPGIWVLSAVVIGGGFGGILGMLLGVPVAATLYKLLQMNTRKRLSMIGSGEE